MNPRTESSDAALVKTEELTKRFGSFTALDKCSLEIYPGEVFGLLGPNGAGKSTLLRLLLGFLNPSAGAATIGGLCCHQNRVQVHRRLSYLPGDARLYRLMKGYGLLRLFCEFREDACFQTALSIAEQLELDLNRWVGLMSTGMRQKLALSICLSNQAPLVILDEPTANLDPTVRGQVIELIRKLKAEGRTVIFSSHVLPEIEDTCDRVAILKKGLLVHQESLADLNRQHRITANLTGEIPEVPTELESSISIKLSGQQVQIETPGELSKVLKWLANAPLADVMIQPVGLRSVYDRVHHADSIASQSEVAVR